MNRLSIGFVMSFASILVLIIIITNINVQGHLSVLDLIIIFFSLVTLADGAWKMLTTFLD